MQWIENYLNTPEIKAELGAPDKLKFASCNMQVNQYVLDFSYPQMLY